MSKKNLKTKTSISHQALRVSDPLTKMATVLNGKPTVSDSRAVKKEIEKMGYSKTAVTPILHNNLIRIEMANTQ